MISRSRLATKLVHVEFTRDNLNMAEAKKECVVLQSDVSLDLPFCFVLSVRGCISPTKHKDLEAVLTESLEGTQRHLR